MKLACSTLAVALFLAAPLAQAQSAAPPASVATPAPATVDDAAIDDIPDASAADETAAKAEEAAAPARDPSAMDPAPANPALRPVLDQFGGEPGLVALMDLFMTKLVADPRTKPFFENSNQAAVKKHLVEQFCVILGGGCTYTGRDMRTAHKGFDIQRSQFNALVEDLQKAMSERKIPFRAQNQLLAKLAPLHRDIEHR
jgi:hemoglobin